MNIKVVGGAIVGALIGLVLYQNMSSPVSVARTIASAKPVVVVQQAVQKGGISALKAPDFSQEKAVQYYCLENYEAASCIAYTYECGVRCINLLPLTARQRMLQDYNAYLAKNGRKPIVLKMQPATIKR